MCSPLVDNAKGFSKVIALNYDATSFTSLQTLVITSLILLNLNHPMGVWLHLIVVLICFF